MVLPYSIGSRVKFSPDTLQFVNNVVHFRFTFSRSIGLKSPGRVPFACHPASPEGPARLRSKCASFRRLDETDDGLALAVLGAFRLAEVGLFGPFPCRLGSLEGSEDTALGSNNVEHFVSFAFRLASTGLSGRFEVISPPHFTLLESTPLVRRKIRSILFRRNRNPFCLLCVSVPPDSWFVSKAPHPCLGGLGETITRV